MVGLLLLKQLHNLGRNGRSRSGATERSEIDCAQRSQGCRRRAASKPMLAVLLRV
jgi:hypothetical protein